MFSKLFTLFYFSRKFWPTFWPFFQVKPRPRRASRKFFGPFSCAKRSGIITKIWITSCPRISTSLTWPTASSWRSSILGTSRSSRGFEILCQRLCATWPRSRCQFHQHFTPDFFVHKCFAQLFSFSLGLVVFFGIRMLVQKLLVKCWWNWLQVMWIQITCVTTFMDKLRFESSLDYMEAFACPIPSQVGGYDLL